MVGFGIELVKCLCVWLRVGVVSERVAQVIVFMCVCVATLVRF